MKTSLAPGSKVVTEYLRQVGPAARPRGPRLPRGGLRLHDLHRQQRAAARPRCRRPSNDGKLVAAAVLSGNRNFEGRVNPDVKANYLASPPLVVAYALAGTTDIDLATEPIGTARRRGAGRCSPTSGRPRRRWRSSRPRSGRRCSQASYGNVFDGNPDWNAIPVAGGDLFAFREDSTYIQEPPFFQGLTQDARAAHRHRGRARPRRPRRLRDHRPHLARRRHRARRAPPAASSWRRASRRRTSTPTARGAATTA